MRLAMKKNSYLCSQVDSVVANTKPPAATNTQIKSYETT